MFKKLSTSIIENPKNIFLVDGIGALISAFSLGVVLVYFENFFGIPSTALYFLAAFPILFAMYDFCCYFLVKENLRFYIRLIAIVNILYCLLSLATAFYHQEVIEYLGWIYIILEIIVVLIIVRIELNLAKQLSRIQANP